MKFKNNQPQAGFTVVEVLVAMTVSILFLLAGFSLHSAVLHNQALANTSAKASDIAYSYLRKRVANEASYKGATIPPVRTFSETIDPNSAKIDGMSVESKISKPNPGLDGLYRIETTVKYSFKGKNLTESQVLYAN